MANPNKTVAKAAARRPFDQARQSSKDASAGSRRDPFFTFISEKAKEGVIFTTMEEAQKAFDTENSGR